MAIYIFGYWSLINKRSAQKTGQTYGEFIPVKISGYRRHCEMLVPEIWMQAFWIELFEWWLTNWVIYMVEPSELSKYDERELWYKRLLIDSWSLEFYDKKKQLDHWDKVYLYQSEKWNKHDIDLPIPMSYIDVCIDGCLDFWEKFAKDFCENTYFPKKITRDRSEPIYVRALDDGNNFTQIDRIYSTYLQTQIWK